jgi:hypothetical protein
VSVLTLEGLAGGAADMLAEGESRSILKLFPGGFFCSVEIRCFFLGDGGGDAGGGELEDSKIPPDRYSSIDCRDGL